MNFPTKFLIQIQVQMNLFFFLRETNFFKNCDFGDCIPDTNKIEGKTN